MMASNTLSLLTLKMQRASLNVPLLAKFRAIYLISLVTGGSKWASKRSSWWLSYDGVRNACTLEKAATSEYDLPPFMPRFLSLFCDLHVSILPSL